MEWIDGTITSGSLLLALPIALAAGVVSFFSPCVLPLLPGYLSYATGVSGADLMQDPGTVRRSRMLVGGIGFVVGLVAFFAITGALVGSLGHWLAVNERPLQVVLGILNIALGFIFLGLLPGFGSGLKFSKLPDIGVAASPVIGFLFAISWLPCIGPVYGAIVGLSYQEQDFARSGVLSGVYALGLGLPFIIGAVAYRKLLGTMAFFRRHQIWVMRFGGVMLIAVGVVLVSGLWQELTTWLQYQFVGSYTPPL